MSSHRLLARVLSPGMRLMRRWPLSTKFMALSVLAFLSTLVLALHGVAVSVEQWQRTAQEREGVGMARVVLRASHDVQLHRDLWHHASLDVQAVSTLAAHRRAMQSSLTELDATLLALPEPYRTQAWPSRQADMAALERLPLGHHGQAAAEALHGQVLQAIRQAAWLVGESSTLLLDPESTTYFLMSLALDRIPTLSAEASERRALVWQAWHSASPAVGDEAVLAGAVQRALEDVQFQWEALRRSGGHVPASWETVRASLAAADPSAPERLMIHAQALHQATVALNQGILDQLDARLQDRSQALAGSIGLAVAVLLFNLLVLGYFVTALHSALMGTMKVITRTMDDMGQGDLTQRRTVQGSDEMADVARGLQGVGERLSRIVASIRSNAVLLAMAGKDMGEGTMALAVRTEQQSGRLKELAERVRQGHQATDEGARHAQVLMTQVHGVRASAQSGQEQMPVAASTMSAIEQGARRMTEIVSLIEDIAFQTNMLALNASVEAARAGEAGAGFAVVAAQVRQLATRCAQAVGEISELIAASTLQVGDGVRHMSAIQSAFDELVDGLDQIHGGVTQVAQIVAQQSATLGDMSSSLDSLDSITRENGVAVNRSYAASEQLVERAASLSQAVRGIRLSQGSPDEAQALAERAAQLIRDRGVEAALPVLQDPSNDFIDRDLSVFGLNRQGHYVFSSLEPAMAGHPIPMLTSTDGHLFQEALWRAAESGQAWVEYESCDPDTLQMSIKMAHVVPMNDDLIVVAPVYKDPLNAQSSRPAMAGHTPRSSHHGQTGASRRLSLKEAV
jgi:methyl-accepting chemotaxis protein